MIGIIIPVYRQETQKFKQLVVLLAFSSRLLLTLVPNYCPSHMGKYSLFTDSYCFNAF